LARRRGRAIPPAAASQAGAPSPAPSCRERRAKGGRTR
jgi:hypothetical protein